MRGIAAALLSISLAVSATVAVTSVSEAQNRSSWDTGRFVVGKTTCLQARHSCSLSRRMSETVRKLRGYGLLERWPR
jgi:hypothetical protein